MIEYASKGRVYFSARADFLVVESLPGVNAPYVIFFNVEKAKKIDEQFTTWQCLHHKRHIQKPELARSLTGSDFQKP